MLRTVALAGVKGEQVLGSSRRVWTRSEATARGARCFLHHHGCATEAETLGADGTEEERANKSSGELERLECFTFF